MTTATNSTKQSSSGSNGSNGRSTQVWRVWHQHAPALADWAMERYVNRTDILGNYFVSTNVKYGPIGSTVPTTRHDPLTRDLLLKHFRATATDHVIGAHAIAPNNTSKWIAIDLDIHGANPDPDLAKKLLAAALDWHAVLSLRGFHPLLTDSNDKGGLHLICFLKEPVPTDKANAFIRNLTCNYQFYGLPKEPEYYPRQVAVTDKNPCGYWLRIEGRHHSKPHWSKVWDGNKWLEGAEAVAYLLALTGDSPECILGPAMPPEDDPADPAALARHKERRAAGYMAKLPTGLADGDGRDQTAFNAFCFLVRDLAMSDADALRHLEAWNSQNADPLSADKLQEKLANAHRYGSRPYGAGLGSNGSTGSQTKQDTAQTKRRDIGKEEAQSLFDRIAGFANTSDLLADEELMQDLAILSMKPDAHSRIIAIARDHDLKVNDIKRTLTHLRNEYIKTLPPMPNATGPYQTRNGQTYYLKQTDQSAVPIAVPLANFVAVIREQLTVDDGAERHISFAIDGMMQGNAPLPRIDVPATDFPNMRWPVMLWGTRAVVYAGVNAADHMRAGIQLTSGDVPERVVFAHLGWRELDGTWTYLHAGGGLDEDGAAELVEVRVPDALANFILPDPTKAKPEDVKSAVNTSLRLLGVAPDRVMVPVLGAVYRSVLATADFSLFLCGLTGIGKTELATFAQQHFGAAMDSRHLPGTWASTGNSLEALAFAAKDALLTIDDFAPTGSSADVAKFHREADRFFRAQGNRSGRGRLRADGTLRPAKSPRGLAIASGEDLPRGHSLRARLLGLELTREEVKFHRFSQCQKDGQDGVYALAMAAFICWLAKRYQTIKDELKAQTDALRDKLGKRLRQTDADTNSDADETDDRTKGEADDEAVEAQHHARTPTTIAELAIGWKYFLDFALDTGAIELATREALAVRARDALLDVAAHQAEFTEEAEPTGQFLRLLAGAIASGRAHVKGPEGGIPPDPQAWGWRSEEIFKRDGTSDLRWHEQGRCVAWLKGDELCLQPEAAYAESQVMARDQGTALPVSDGTLWKRMKERNLLTKHGTKRLQVRRDLEGQRRYVLIISPQTLVLCGKVSQVSQVSQEGGSTGSLGSLGSLSGVGDTPTGEKNAGDEVPF
jgi:hypothetical protein